VTTARRFIGNHWVLVVVVAAITVVTGDRLLSRAIDTELPRYTFAVDIGERSLGTFREVSGLDVEFEVVEYRDGSGGPVRYLPGLTRYSTIKLVRAFNGGTELSDWFTAFSQSPTERVAGSIAMYDQNRTEVARWTFQNAWPKKLSGPTLRAGSNEVPIESIELAHEGLTRAPLPR